jgi:hypothetical protein
VGKTKKPRGTHELQIPIQAINHPLTTSIIQGISVEMRNQLQKTEVRDLMSIGSRFLITTSECDCQYSNESTHSQFTKAKCNKLTTTSSLTV